MKSFYAESRVGSELLGSGSGSSKKEAEQMAAEVAWTELNRRAKAVPASVGEPVATAESEDRSASDRRSEDRRTDDRRTDSGASADSEQDA
jgi:hypothetical protein